MWIKYFGLHYWAYQLYQQFQPQINWSEYPYILKNSTNWARQIIVDNLEHIATHHNYWKSALAENEADWAYQLLVEHDGVVFNSLSFDNSAEWMHPIILENVDNLDWCELCRNEAKWAIPIFLSNLEKVNWVELSKNTSLLLL